MGRILHLVVLAVGLLVATSTAARDADRGSQSNVCRSEILGTAAVAPQEKIAACSALLASANIDARQRSTYFIYRANAYAALDDQLRQRADLVSAIDADPKNSYAWAKNCAAHNWGVADKSRALVHCDMALKLNPADAGAWTHRGDVYLDMARYPEAISDYSRSIRLHKTWMWPWINRGVAYRRMGRVDLAIENFDRALRLSPDFSEGYVERGITRLVEGRLDLALVDFERGLKVHDRCAKCVYGRAVIRARRGDPQGSAIDRAQAVAWDANAARDFAAENIRSD